MVKKLRFHLLALFAGVCILGCVSTKPAVDPLAGNDSSIQAESPGLSPNGDGVADSLTLSLFAGQKEKLESWKVMIRNGADSVRTFTGRLPAPEELVWDGKGDSGTVVSEGAYTAVAQFTYGGGGDPVEVSSRGFVVALTPPAGSLSIDPQAGFARVPVAGSAPVGISLQAKSSVAAINSWNLEILSPDGKRFRAFSGKWPAGTVVWDGLDKNGVVVESGKKYTVKASFRDEYGNEGSVSGIIAVGALPLTGETVAVTLETPGFSPNGDGTMDTMALALAYGKSSALDTWKLEILGTAAAPVKTFSGTARTLPSVVSWDGTSESGTRAQEGAYKAVLSVSYGTAYAPAKAESATFKLDVTPPKGKLTMTPALFSPDGDGRADIATFRVSPEGIERDIEAWTIKVYDPEGSLFADFGGEWPVDSVTWDGKGITGDLVESAADYSATARIEDAFGNSTEIKKAVPIDILVVRTERGFRVRVAGIVFKGFTADFLNVVADRAARNKDTLSGLAEMFRKFPDYRISIVGHAVMMYWDDPEAGRVEQERILLPLSRARAEAIKQALVERGISAERMTTDGVGALEPLVPDSDMANRWKNRRVDFFLEK